MGAKSTIRLSRQRAVELIERLLAVASDEGIANALEMLNDDRWDAHDWSNTIGLNNFSVGPYQDEA